MMVLSRGTAAIMLQLPASAQYHASGEYAADARREDEEWQLRPCCDLVHWPAGLYLQALSTPWCAPPEQAAADAYGELEDLRDELRAAQAAKAVGKQQAAELARLKREQGNATAELQRQLDAAAVRSSGLAAPFLLRTRFIRHVVLLWCLPMISYICPCFAHSATVDPSTLPGSLLGFSGRAVTIPGALSSLRQH